MKKNFLYLTMFAVALAFTACSTDGEDVSVSNQSATSSAAPALSENTAESSTYIISDSDAPFSEMSILDDHKVILTLNTPAPAAKRRALGMNANYMVGTYTFNSTTNTYTIKNEQGEDYCQVEMTSLAIGSKKTLKIRLLNGYEIEQFEKEFEADVVTKVDDNVFTTKLCREWQVVSTRLRHKDGVTAVKHFDNPAEAASLNAILDYAKTVATITETLDPNTVITSIQFTSDGKFCFFFQNGKHYIGTWSVEDINKGYLYYNWNDETMGNKFMNDGRAIFDVRTYKQTNYFVLTLAAQIKEKDKSYNVELSFYLKEK
ncbi:MAG: hypothetical protein IKH80_05280 [Bacteroidaceae bacterium]|nr:hypothetical protein [Bacteroidaceae bacterium]